MQEVVKTDPKASRWHVVCDRLNTHQSESLIRWVAELLGIEKDLGVKGESSILASIISVEDLQTRVFAFINYYNQTLAKPFKWTDQGKALII